MIEPSWKIYGNLLTEAFSTVKSDSIAASITLLRAIVGTEKTVWVIGNGGSAATASHFAVDLAKGCSIRIEKSLRAISLMDLVPIQTAWSNDDSYDVALERTLENFLQPADLVFAISGSGNSKNILNAIVLAKKNGIQTIGLTGFNGGRMSDLLSVEINVNSEDMQIIEDLHLSICHFISREI